jgi:hypothetical protein
MQAIADLMASGQIRSHVSNTFAVEEMALAHLEMEKDNTQGKIVISLQAATDGYFNQPHYDAVTQRGSEGASRN